MEGGDRALCLSEGVYAPLESRHIVEMGLPPYLLSSYTSSVMEIWTCFIWGFSNGKTKLFTVKSQVREEPMALNPWNVPVQQQLPQSPLSFPT